MPEGKGQDPNPSTGRPRSGKPRPRPPTGRPDGGGRPPRGRPPTGRRPPRGRPPTSRPPDPAIAKLKQRLTELEARLTGDGFLEGVVEKTLEAVAGPLEKRVEDAVTRLVETSSGSSGREEVFRALEERLGELEASADAVPPGSKEQPASDVEERLGALEQRVTKTRTLLEEWTGALDGRVTELALSRPEGLEALEERLAVLDQRVTAVVGAGQALEKRLGALKKAEG